MASSLFLTKALGIMKNNSKCSSCIITRHTTNTIITTRNIHHIRPHSHKVQQNKIIKVQPQHLFNIILDVDKYSSFLPFCNQSKIIRYSKCGNIFDAVLQIGGMFQEEYVSRVTKKIQHVGNHDDDKDDDVNSLEWIVEAKSIKSSLFHGLNSSWRLTQVENDGGATGTGVVTAPPIKNRSVIESNNIHGIEINSEHNYNCHSHSHSNSNHSDDSIIYTNVEFEVEISVSNPIISAALDASLENVAKQQVLAFEKRCLELQYIN
jgi:coenzyme Q-binding protein COQ10